MRNVGFHHADAAISRDNDKHAAPPISVVLLLMSSNGNLCAFGVAGSTSQYGAKLPQFRADCNFKWLKPRI